MRYTINDNGCWIWNGAKGKLGYGYATRVRLDSGKTERLAHRIFYILHVGPIPKGTEIDHLCRDRACVNPEHLEAVTHKVNCKRGAKKRPKKTHCKHGHPLSGDNLYLHVSPKRTTRACKQCRNDAVRRSQGYQGGTVNIKKTHCKHGHPLSGDNLYLYSDGRRECRECRRVRTGYTGKGRW